MQQFNNIRKIMRGIGAYTLLSLVASFCNFLFNFILIRMLSAGQFRDLALANNMINVFGNIFVALNIVSIALFYVAKEQQADIIRAIQKIIYIIYLALFVGGIVLNSQVEQRTGLHDTLVLSLTFAVILSSIPVMVLNAIYLGSYRFNKSAILNVCLALGRLVLGFLGAFFITAHKDAAAVGGILMVFVIVFGLFTVLEKGEYRKQNFEIFKKVWDAPIHLLKQYRLLVVSSVIYALTINFLLGLDLFMFGQFFSDEQSSAYAAVSVIGKLVFFFIMPISLYLAARQQRLIHAKPKVAIRTTLAVTGLIAMTGLVLILLPLPIVSTFIHRPAADINHLYLILSIMFNAAVALTNHMLIEGIVGNRQRLVLAASGILLAINGVLFIGFRSIEQALDLHASAGLALGIPAVTMAFTSLVLFAGVHLVRRRDMAA